MDPKLKALLTEVRDIAAKAEADGRDLSDDERATVTDRLNKITELKNQLKASAASVALREQMVQAISEHEADDLNDAALKGAKAGAQLVGRGLGESYVAGDGYKSFQKQFPNGLPPTFKGISLPPTKVDSRALLGRKALTGVTETTGLVRPDYYPNVPLVFPPLVLRSLITVGTTGSDTIEYAQLNNWTNNAAMVPTAVDITGNVGVKPQSLLSFGKVIESVKTVAHWLAVTKRAVSDAAQLRTYIDQFLEVGLATEIEDQILNGDGTGENFTGILHTTGVQAQGFVAPPSGGVPSYSAMAGIRQAITLIRTYGGSPNGILVSYEDDENFDLATDQLGRFFGQGPFGTGPNTLWGLPRIPSIKLAAGTAVVGDFRTCVLWDREEATITISDSHADFFIRNLLAILGELRAAFGILNPKLLATVALTD